MNGTFCWPDGSIYSRLISWMSWNIVEDFSLHHFVQHSVNSCVYLAVCQNKGTLVDHPN